MNIGADANKPDWKLVKAFLLKEGALAKEHLVAVCRTSIEIMSKLSFKCFCRKRAKLMQDRRTYCHSGRYPWSVL